MQLGQALIAQPLSNIIVLEPECVCAVGNQITSSLTVLLSQKGEAASSFEETWLNLTLTLLNFNSTCNSLPLLALIIYATEDSFLDEKLAQQTGISRKLLLTPSQVNGHNTMPVHLLLSRSHHEAIHPCCLKLAKSCLPEAQPSAETPDLSSVPAEYHNLGRCSTRPTLSPYCIQYNP